MTPTADVDLVDADVVDETPTAEPEPPTTALVRRERRSEVIRPLDATELVDSFKQYQELLPRLLNDTDYQDAGRGKRFVKKSGWRKIATAFDLDVQIIRSTIERDAQGQPARAEVWARAIAPSGRSMDGDGYCSVDEDRFSGPRGNKSKLENDLRATATTRAMNRAISGLVGMGEVSAEEVGPHDVVELPAWAAEATDARKAQLIESLERIIGDRDNAKAMCVAMKGNLGHVPDVVVSVAAGIVGYLDAQPPADEDDPADAQIKAAQETLDATDVQP